MKDFNFWKCGNCQNSWSDCEKVVCPVCHLKKEDAIQFKRPVDTWTPRTQDLVDLKTKPIKSTIDVGEFYWVYKGSMIGEHIYLATPLIVDEQYGSAKFWRVVYKNISLITSDWNITVIEKVKKPNG